MNIKKKKYDSLLESCGNLSEKQVLMGQGPVQKLHQVWGTEKDNGILMIHLKIEFTAGNLVGAVKTSSFVAE